MQQFSQWFIVILLPITTLIFICGGIQAHRTHGCSFDSIVLYLCAVYNLFFLFEYFIKCSRSGMFVKALYVTSMILYLFFNFEELLKQLEYQNLKARERAICRSRPESSSINVAPLNTS